MTAVRNINESRGQLSLEVLVILAVGLVSAALVGVFASNLISISEGIEAQTEAFGGVVAETLEQPEFERAQQFLPDLTITENIRFVSAAETAAAAAESGVIGSALVEVGEIKASESATLTLTQDQATQTGISEITISAANQIPDRSQVTVQKFSDKPATLAIAPLAVQEDAAIPVYAYLEITAVGFTNNDVEEATIKFQVEKAWLTENGLSDAQIVLSRFSGDAWAELPTTVVTPDDTQDDTYVYYSAVSPGFSTFAITPQAPVRPSSVVPVALWQFNGNSRADSTGQAGQVIGGNLVSGRFAGGLELTSGSATLNSDWFSSSGSIELWFKPSLEYSPSSPASQRAYLFSGFEESPVAWIREVNNNPGVLSVCIKNTAGQNACVNSQTKAWLKGRWYHLAVTWEGIGTTGILKVYVNGVLESENRNAGVPKAGSVPNNKWQLGRGYGETKPIKAVFDEVGIYNVVKSTTEIAEDAAAHVEYVYVAPSLPLLNAAPERDLQNPEIEFATIQGSNVYLSPAASFISTPTLPSISEFTDADHLLSTQLGIFNSLTKFYVAKYTTVQGFKRIEGYYKVPDSTASYPLYIDLNGDDLADYWFSRSGIANWYNRYCARTDRTGSWLYGSSAGLKTEHNCEQGSVVTNMADNYAFKFHITTRDEIRVSTGLAGTDPLKDKMTNAVTLSIQAPPTAGEVAEPMPSKPVDTCVASTLSTIAPNEIKERAVLTLDGSKDDFDCADRYSLQGDADAQRKIYVARAANTRKTHVHFDADINELNNFVLAHAYIDIDNDNTADIDMMKQFSRSQVTSGGQTSTTERTLYSISCFNARATTKWEVGNCADRGVQHTQTGVSSDKPIEASFEPRFPSIKIATQEPSNIQSPILRGTVYEFLTGVRAVVEQVVSRDIVSASATLNLLTTLNAPKDFKLTTPIAGFTATSVKSISISSSKQLSPGSITIEKLSRMPAGLTDPGLDNIFTRLSITSQGFYIADVTQATLEFDIPKTWLQANIPRTWLQANNAGSQAISVYRYEVDKWTEYKAELVSQDIATASFKAVLPGLSVLVIGERTVPTAPAAPTEAEPAAEEPEVPAVTAPAVGTAVSATPRGEPISGNLEFDVYNIGRVDYPPTRLPVLAASSKPRVLQYPQIGFQTPAQTTPELTVSDYTKIQDALALEQNTFSEQELIIAAQYAKQKCTETGALGPSVSVINTPFTNLNDLAGPRNGEASWYITNTGSTAATGVQIKIDVRVFFDGGRTFTAIEKRDVPAGQTIVINLADPSILYRITPSGSPVRWSDMLTTLRGIDTVTMTATVANDPNQNDNRGTAKLTSTSPYTWQLTSPDFNTQVASTVQVDYCRYQPLLLVAILKSPDQYGFNLESFLQQRVAEQLITQAEIVVPGRGALVDASLYTAECYAELPLLTEEGGAETTDEGQAQSSAVCQGQPIASVRVPSTQAGTFNTLRMQNLELYTGQDYVLVVDPQDGLVESREDNNAIRFKGADLVALRPVEAPLISLPREIIDILLPPTAGAVGDVTVGSFDTATSYQLNDPFGGAYSIASLDAKIASLQGVLLRTEDLSFTRAAGENIQDLVFQDNMLSMPVKPSALPQGIDTTSFFYVNSAWQRDSYGLQFIDKSQQGVSDGVARFKAVDPSGVLKTRCYVVESTAKITISEGGNCGENSRGSSLLTEALSKIDYSGLGIQDIHFSDPNNGVIGGLIISGGNTYAMLAITETGGDDWVIYLVREAATHTVLVGHSLGKPVALLSDSRLVYIEDGKVKKSIDLANLGGGFDMMATSSTDVYLGEKATGKVYKISALDATQAKLDYQAVQSNAESLAGLAGARGLFASDDRDIGYPIIEFQFPSLSTGRRIVDTSAQQTTTLGAQRTLVANSKKRDNAILVLNNVKSTGGTRITGYTVRLKDSTKILASGLALQPSISQLLISLPLQAVEFNSQGITDQPLQITFQQENGATTTIDGPKVYDIAKDTRSKAALDLLERDISKSITEIPSISFGVKKKEQVPFEVKTEVTVTKFVCPDGSTVDAVANCPSVPGAPAIDFDALRQQNFGAFCEAVDDELSNRISVDCLKTIAEFGISMLPSNLVLKEGHLNGMCDLFETRHPELAEYISAYCPLAVASVINTEAIAAVLGTGSASAPTVNDLGGESHALAIDQVNEREIKGSKVFANIKKGTKIYLYSIKQGAEKRYQIKDFASLAAYYDRMFVLNSEFYIVGVNIVLPVMVSSDGVENAKLGVILSPDFGDTWDFIEIAEKPADLDTDVSSYVHVQHEYDFKFGDMACNTGACVFGYYRGTYSGTDYKIPKSLGYIKFFLIDEELPRVRKQFSETTESWTISAVTTSPPSITYTFVGYQTETGPIYNIRRIKYVLGEIYDISIDEQSVVVFDADKASRDVSFWGGADQWAYTRMTLKIPVGSDKDYSLARGLG